MDGDIEQRRTEILKDGEWIQCRFRDLKSGDTFRLFEPTGEPVVLRKDKTDFIALSDAYQNEDGIWTIEVGGSVE